MGPDNGGHVPQFDRRPVDGGDGHILDVGQVFEPAQCPDDILRVAVPQGSTRSVDVLLPKGFGHQGDGNAKTGQAGFIDLDPDLLLQAAGHPGGSHTGKRFDLLFQDIVGHVSQLDQLCVA